VILMSQFNQKLEILFGNKNLNDLKNNNPFQIFDDRVIEFFDDLSKSLLKGKEVKYFPDVVSFLFFSRKSNLNKIKNNYLEQKKNLGRGLSFHISPSNVPINFAYTLLAGLISGNKCIVRVTSKEFDQVTFLISEIKKKLNLRKYLFIKKNILVIKYKYDKEITDYLSKISDIRIIWGGDKTVTEIRKSPIKPRSFDITFADRYSACLIDTNYYINSEDKTKIANNFFNDTYYFYQKACSSPHLIFWLGDKDQYLKAKKVFWEKLYQVLEKKKFTLDSFSILNKYKIICGSAFKNNHESIKIYKDNRINIIKLKKLNKNVFSISCGDGLFAEYQSKNINSLIKIMSQKFQTLTYIGNKKEKVLEKIINNSPKGLDRLVEVGEAGNFSFDWDGYDLVRHMSRKIN